ncbi:MAG: excisionase [Magnetococcales bacterium]|nr:excisionase [Magnetococcales bacterium]
MIMTKWVTIKKLSELTGYSQDAIRHKMSGGVWPEGVIWRKAPDNRVMINLREYERWVEGQIKVA